MINSQNKFSTYHLIFALFAMMVFLIVKTILFGLTQTTVRSVQNVSFVVGYVSLWKTGLNIDITPKLGEPVFAKNKF